MQHDPSLFALHPVTLHQPGSIQNKCPLASTTEAPAQLTASCQAARTQMDSTQKDACLALIDQLINCADHIQCEKLYDELMVISRRSTLQELSNSKMPVSLKQRYAELRMIDTTVAVFARNPHSCAVILTRLTENIAHGPGHFSVHRAKQALRRIAQPPKSPDPQVFGARSPQSLYTTGSGI